MNQARSRDDEDDDEDEQVEHEMRAYLFSIFTRPIIADGYVRIDNPQSP